MSSPNSQQPSAQQAWRRNERQRRNRRTLVSIGISAGVVAGIVVVLFWITGGTSASSQAVITTPASPLPVNTPPQHVVIAQAPLVSIAVPVNTSVVTAIAFRSIPDPSAIELTPTGPLPEHDEGASGSALPDLELDVGAPAGTVVYSPVDGQIIGIYDNIVQGQVQGYRVLIAPQGAPGTAVSVTHVVAHPGGPAPSVGQAVLSGVTPLGQIIDLSGIETQDLSQFSGDAGNHVAIELQRMANPS
jgi:hypothetical protein